MNAILRHLQQQRPFDTVAEEVFVGLQLAANRLMEPWARYLRETADLTEVQYNVLRILRGAGPDGVRVQELGCRLITRSPDVTRLIDRLERSSLVSRRPDPGDGRAVRVHITDTGLERLIPLDNRAKELLGEHLGRMDEERLSVLSGLLGEVLDAVRDGCAAVDSRTGGGQDAVPDKGERFDG